jgi:cytochrome c oxidase assembly factor CtaG
MTGVVLAGVVVAWHAPVLYEAAMRTDAVHVLEHVTFLGAGVLFWWALVSPVRGESVLIAFITALPLAVLGLGMTLSRTRWYAVYDAPISDQQVAGAVMWGGGGALTVLAALVLFYAWMASAAARSEQSFHANAAAAAGSANSATRNVQMTGSIDTPSFWA